MEVATGHKRQPDALQHSRRHDQPHVDGKYMEQRRDSEHGGPGERDPLSADAVDPLSGERPDDQSYDAERPDDYAKLPVSSTALDDVQRDERKHRRVRRKDTVCDEQVENVVPRPEAGGFSGGQVRGACGKECHLG